MKKVYAFLLMGIVLAFSGCDSKSSVKVIKVGATPVPHAEILDAIKPLLAKDGYTLEVTVFNDYVIPNKAVFEKELDANFFQHIPYLNEFNKNEKTDLIKTVSVHIEPIGAYSLKIKSIDELAEGASVAVPNDPTNENRALELLEKAGLIKLASDKELKTKLDVIENPKNLEITEIEAAQLPRTINDFDLSVINTNYALTIDLNPIKDALLLEDKDSPYANILVVKSGNENKDAIKALGKALNSEEARTFIRERYQGAIVEAF